MGSFIAGISVFCFAASYTVTLALEISRLWFRSGVRGAVMLGFAGAGLLAQVLFLGYRAYADVALSSPPVSPLSSAFDYYLVAALSLVIFYLYLTYYHPQAAIGLFLMPMVLILIAVARFGADPKPFPQAFSTQVWGMIHGIFWLIGTVAMLFGFMAGLMYLLQSRRLKSKLPAPRGLKLPSLEWLERANSRAIVISVVGVGLGILSGLILNLVNHRKQVDELPWTDPVILTSALLTLWVFAAALFSWFYKPAQRGHKVAYLTVATGVVLACHLAISLLATSQHGSRAGGNGESAGRAKFELRSSLVSHPSSLASPFRREFA